MFLSKKRIDEDIEIMRRSFMNMPMLETETKEEEEKTTQASNVSDPQDEWSFSDFLGFCGAAFAVIMPWAIAFAVLLGLAGWLLTVWVR